MKSIGFSLLFVIGTLNLMSQEINKTIFIQENSMVTYTQSYGSNILSIPEWQIYSNTKLGYVFAKHHACFVFNSIDYNKLIYNHKIRRQMNCDFFVTLVCSYF